MFKPGQKVRIKQIDIPLVTFRDYDLRQGDELTVVTQYPLMSPQMRHRMFQATKSQGPYVGVTPSRHFPGYLIFPASYLEEIG